MVASSAITTLREQGVDRWLQIQGAASHLGDAGYAHGVLKLLKSVHVNAVARD